MIEWRRWMAKYYPSGDADDGNNVYGYLEAETLAHVLKQCGDDLSRETIMKEATSLHGLSLSLLLPGITLNTSPTDYRPMSFNGKNWSCSASC